MRVNLVDGITYFVALVVIGFQAFIGRTGVDQNKSVGGKQK